MCCASPRLDLERAQGSQTSVHILHHTLCAAPQKHSENMAAHSSIALNSHPQPHYHNLPYAKNKKFYGREDILHQIEGSLSSSTESPASVLLHGLGGIGKTEIALAYAWQNLAKFGCILWINCSSAISIERDLTAAAQGLRLRGVVPQDHYLNRQILLQWLESTCMATSPLRKRIR